MPTLCIRFPGGRYHATPWGHHVNEGLIEWPPSPWRIMRALISTGYTACGWTAERPPVVACSLIEKMASVLPNYLLPQASGSHSRHYMPLARFKNGREETTLVFDTWAQVDRGELEVTWDVDLSTEETFMLFQLAEKISYLGRSESWVVARLAETSSQPDRHNCFPCEGSQMPGPGWEQVPLIAPQHPADLVRWRKAAIQSALAGLPAVDRGKKRLTKKDQKLIAEHERAAEAYPVDLVSCLQVETAWLHKHGWSQPPGSQKVLYWRRSDSLEVGAPRLKRSSVTPEPVQAMLLSIATSTGNSHALPPIERTLPQAELLHRALVSAVAKRAETPTKVLTGCDEVGDPLTEPHQHAHLLPLDLDHDGRIEHFLIWAPMGLDGTAQAAVRAVRQTYMKGGSGALRVALAAAGTLDELRLLPGSYGDALRAVLGPRTGAEEWQSLTPFVPPRYVKKRGRNTLEGQILAELTSRGIFPPVEVCILDPRDHPDLLRQRHFIRSRTRGTHATCQLGLLTRPSVRRADLRAPLLRLREPLWVGPLCDLQGRLKGVTGQSRSGMDHVKIGSLFTIPGGGEVLDLKGVFSKVGDTMP